MGLLDFSMETVVQSPPKQSKAKAKQVKKQRKFLEISNNYNKE